ncbi:MAG: ACP S-malonyltransferase [Rhizobacter sp.]
MFPGQGSQKRGMGQGLFDEVPEFKAVESQVDDILGYSLRQLCLEDTEDKLKDTRYTQPCLYAVNALHYYKAASEGPLPDVFIGHSLGEYNALLAAGAFDFLTGLRMVKKRGELMAQARSGSMTAVIGITPARIAAVLQEQRFTSIDVANFNSPTQTVISGPPEDLARVSQPLQAAGAQMVVPLTVSAAFHSRYMFDAAKSFDAYLGEFSFAPLQKPVVANATARPYPSTDPDTFVRQLLSKQIAHPVQWTRSIRHLLDDGAAKFHEIGPGSVLTRLIEQIRHVS